MYILIAYAAHSTVASQLRIECTVGFTKKKDIMQILNSYVASTTREDFIP